MKCDVDNKANGFFYIKGWDYPLCLYCMKYIGPMRCVLFSPEYLQLVTGCSFDITIPIATQFLNCPPHMKNTCKHSICSCSLLFSYKRANLCHPLIYESFMSVKLFEDEKCYIIAM